MTAGPQWAMATLLFADLRGFTAFADRTTAVEAVARLNAFFEAIVPPVLHEGGRVEQLLGDGLLARFDGPAHADRALAAGLAMTAAAVDRWPMGVGLNSGLVLVGRMGGGGWTQETVAGDPVNVAARVQDATRALGEPLLLTEATRMLLDDPPPLAPRGVLALRGKAQPIAVHAPGAAVTQPGRRPARVHPGCPS